MLYKYRNCKNNDGTPNEYIKGILKEGEMFFAVPSSFEDVHDCEINVELHATNPQIRRYWKEELFPFDPDFESFLHKKHWWGDPQKYAKDFNSTQKAKQYNKGATNSKTPERKLSDILGIHCLCENPLKKEMWAKYAKNEGFCIGYNTTFDKNGCPIIKFKEKIFYNDMPAHFLPFLNVNYKDTNHKAINRLPTEEFEKKVKEAILTKDKCWSFEEERRSLVFSNNLKKPLPLNGIPLHCTDDTIKIIIFATDASKDTMNLVISLLDDRPCGRNGVMFYRYDGKDNAIPLDSSFLNKS